MESLIGILPWIQISLAVLLTVLILIQQRGAGAGGAFGGSADGTIHFERRGFEKSLFKFTGVIAVVFVLSVLAQTFITNSPSSYTDTNDIVDIKYSTSSANTINVDEANPLDLSTQPISAGDILDLEISSQDLPVDTTTE